MCMYISVTVSLGAHAQRTILNHTTCTPTSKDYMYFHTHYWEGCGKFGTVAYL